MNGVSPSSVCDAQRHPALAQRRVYLVVLPGRVAEIERDRRAAGQPVHERAQPRQILLQRRRQLEQHGAQLRPQHGRAAEQFGRIVARLPQPLLVRDASRRLEREDETVGNLVAPRRAHGFPGQAVEAAVDLDGRKLLRVVAQHPVGGKLLRIEAAAPLPEQIAAGSCEQLHRHCRARGAAAALRLAPYLSRLRNIQAVFS